MTHSEAGQVGALERHLSLREQVFESLRTAISQRRLETGRLYSVEALSRQLNVSRTPVREALLDLATRGMVRFERNQGFRVVQLSVDDLREVLTLRLLAEVPAAYRATELATANDLANLDEQIEAMRALRNADDSLGLLTADRRFHRRIVEISAHRRLADHLDHLRDLLTLYGHYAHDVRLDLDGHLDDHGDIVAAMHRRDPSAAAAAARTHILNIGHDMLVHAGATEVTLDWAGAVAIPTPHPSVEERKR